MALGRCGGTTPRLSSRNSVAQVGTGDRYLGLLLREQNIQNKCHISSTVGSYCIWAMTPTTAVARPRVPKLASWTNNHRNSSPPAAMADAASYCHQHLDQRLPSRDRAFHCCLCLDAALSFLPRARGEIDLPVVVSGSRPPQSYVSVALCIDISQFCLNSPFSRLLYSITTANHISKASSKG